jgi:uncharacterized membrane-anchored protein YitT (DUF2179 family)
MKKLFWHKTSYFASLTLFTFVRALGTYVFIIPNSFAPGGLSGISSILYNISLKFYPHLALSVFNPGLTVFVMNIPLILWAFKAIDKKYAVNTALSVGVFSAFMAMFSLVSFPQFVAQNYNSSIMLLASITGGVIIGLGMGAMFRMNMSMGGTDIVAKLIHNKRPVFNVQWMLFFCDGLVVILSGVLGIINITKDDATQDILVKVLSPVLYSFISLFISSKAADIILVGLESSVVFNIVTSKPAEMGAAIVARINRGATILKGEGIYTGEERTILICVVRRKQLLPLKKLMKEIDPGSFSYITNAREVNGFGFHT